MDKIAKDELTKIIDDSTLQITQKQMWYIFIHYTTNKEITPILQALKNNRKDLLPLTKKIQEGISHIKRIAKLKQKIVLL